MPVFNEIDPAGLAALLQGGTVTLVDVRTDAEVARGAIEGALHIPLQTLPARMDELDPARTTVIYCQSGARSAQACMFLAARGYADLINLRGGIVAWHRDGQPLHVPG